MWETVFLIAVWLTITPPANLISDSTDVMLVEFNVPMSTEGLFNKNNYTIVDENNNHINIIYIDVVNSLDGINIPQATLVALVIPKQENRKTFTTTVNGVKSLDNRQINVNRNTYTYFHNGFAPNLERKPDLIIK